ncbi:MAG: hypothetical protein L3K06_04890, partial [Thermoplasmata archaeon]|nr:hypothetical protein [Thermoplasmata archaeon]
LLVLTVDPRDMGLATAMNGVVRSLGSSIGAPIAASLLTTFTAIVVIGTVANTTPPVPILADLPSATAFHDAYLIASALFVIAGVVSLFAQEVLGPRAFDFRTAAVRAAAAPAGSPAPPIASASGRN